MENTTSNKTIFDQMGRLFDKKLVDELNKEYNTNFNVTVVEETDDTFETLHASYNLETAQDLKAKFNKSAEVELLKIILYAVLKQTKSENVSIGIDVSSRKVVSEETFEPRIGLSFKVKSN